MKTAFLSCALFAACWFTAASASEEIHDCGEKFFDIKDTQTNRIPFSGKDDMHEFKVPTQTVSVSVSEEKRKPRIVEEIITIVKAISDMTVNAIPTPEPNKCVSYVQKYKRSTIKVTALDKDKNELAVSKSLIAGPEENLYLSADIPITNIKQLSYDSSTNTVVEKEKPSSVYLGVNWRLGDVFTDYPGSEFYKKFSVKFMLRASSKPSESMGIGLAYSFDAVDVFAARIRTKDDSSVGGQSLGYTDATVVGVSFNITKGLEWLK